MLVTYPTANNRRGRTLRASGSAVVVRLRCWEALVLTALLTIAGDAVAAKVYKWVDQDGNVHFGDRPAGDDAKEMEIKTRQPGAPATGRSTGSATGSSNSTTISDVMEEERLRRKETREKEKQARGKRQRNCALAQDKLRSFKESNYLYDVDNTGKRRILSDAERNAAEQAARADVKRFCG